MEGAAISQLQLTAPEVEAAIRGGLPGAERGDMRVEEVREGYARIRLPFHRWMLRPGDLVSGPTLFTAADSAMYALVLAHIGPQLMAVTANMTINFLNPAPAGDVVAEAKLLRMGFRFSVMEVSLYTEPRAPGSAGAAPGRVLAAHVTGSYAMPRSRRKSTAPGAPAPAPGK
jgi:uncharacterized protein (TIGR00369 family)